MRFRDLALTILRNLKRMRLRVGLTVLGVVIGTSAVILMMAIGSGLNRNITEELESFGAATEITVYPAGENPFEQGDPTAGSAPIRPARLDDDAVRELRRIEGVEAVLARYSLVAEANFGRYSTGIQVDAVDPDEMEAFGFEYEFGREMRASNEVVAGNAVPAMFLGGMFGDPSAPRLDILDERIELSVSEMTETFGEFDVETERVRVVGILDTMDFETDYRVFMPLDTARRMLGIPARRFEYQEAKVQVASADLSEAVSEEIRELGFEAFSLRAEVEAAQQVFVIIQLVLGGIGGIALVVASIGIANTMTMATYERTREIGIMKAVGASNKQIMRLFLGESALIGLVGGVVGLIFSYAVASLANLGLATTLQGGKLFFVSPAIGVFAIVFSAVVGLVAGIMPALRASHLSPLTALRHE